jgi:hypothetical protein
MFEVQTISNDWSSELPGGITWYFIGQPKSGKTTQAASWSPRGSEGVLVLDTDLGADFVDKANVVTIASLNAPVRTKEVDGVKVVKNGNPVAELVPPDERGFYYRTGEKRGKAMPVYSLAEVVATLEKDWASMPYDTVVLDTIDQVNSWVEEVVKKELNIKEMGEGDWGADWGKARRKNTDIVVRLQRFLKKVGGNLVLTSHSKSTTVTDGKAQLSPNLPRGLASALTAKADVIGYTTCNKEDGAYEVSFESYDERMVGSRLKPLAQKSLPFDYQSVLEEINKYKEEEK